MSPLLLVKASVRRSSLSRVSLEELLSGRKTMTTTSTKMARSFFSVKSPPRPASKQVKKKSPLYRTEIIQTVAKEHNLSQALSGRILTTILDLVMESLAEKRPVRLSSFGSFDTKLHKEREGRHPQTGEKLIIPETQRIKFKPYPAFKDSVNK